MKTKRKDYTKEPWGTWTPIATERALYVGDLEPPAREVVNGRYHVAVWYDGSPDHPFGEWVHLSIKDHGRSARHDWRDFQRIKNELVGEQYEAIEIYPAESRLVDTANQYHLYVFKTWRPPMGFHERLVADDALGRSVLAAKAEQRPFEVRPPDCLSGADLDARLRATQAATIGLCARGHINRLPGCADCVDLMAAAGLLQPVAAEE